MLAAAPYTVSTTASVRPPYAELMYPKVQALIQSAYSNSTDAAGLAVKSLQSISKQGVAGNGICETGEMPSTAENFTGQHWLTAFCVMPPVLPAMQENACNVDRLSDYILGASIMLQLSLCSIAPEVQRWLHMLAETHASTPAASFDMLCGSVRYGQDMLGVT